MYTLLNLCCILEYLLAMEPCMELVPYYSQLGFDVLKWGDCLELTHKELVAKVSLDMVACLWKKHYLCSFTLALLGSCLLYDK